MSTTETAKTAEKKIINFNENVNFGQALYAIIPNACSSYTITGIIISITLVLIDNSEISFLILIKLLNGVIICF